MPTTKQPARNKAARTRITEAEHKAVAAAAQLAGLSPSAWLRMIIRQQATAQLTAAGKSSGL